MTYMALRSSGTSPTQPGATVYATWNLMATAVRALYVANTLTDDVTVYVKGGDSHGASGTGNGLLSPEPPQVGNGGGKIILVTTDPGELATPATVQGRIQGYGVVATTLTIKITKLKLYADVSGNDQCYGNNVSSDVHVKIEDCFIAWSGISTKVRCSGSGSSWIRNCTLAFSGGGGGIFMSTANFDNNLVLANTTSTDFQIGVGGSGAITYKNNTLYNYGSKNFEVGSPSNENWLNTVGRWKYSGGSYTGTAMNPNLAGGTMITAPGEALATIIARDADLTSTSAACNTADVATATATDIVGHARG